ncbi:MAG: cobalt-precorrin-5B (C(1))-methyltransferase CbiD [Desulfobacterales bacterium]|nr:cobalt-precorrin-5B (C(1))-methyltransferase CbiD [Desulfobacterales bacterium]
MSRQRNRRKNLRSGFTTGTAAAAAAKAAAMVFYGQSAPAEVDVALLNGGTWTISVQECRREGGVAECRVKKDAGDDPDVTNGAIIGARVKRTGKNGVQITGGEGVGRVTKPGLEVPVGLPAINSGPRKMITQAIEAVAANGIQNAEDGRGIEVEIFVADGEAIARKTLNARLGIVGGISILGTTGVVRPMSHAAYIATIDSAVAVAAASRLDTVVCTTGRRSERHAQAMFAEMPAEAFVQIGDYFEKAMTIMAERGIGNVVLAAFFGKAVKMAKGVPHTHAAKSRMVLEDLARWAAAAGAESKVAERVGGANTAREAFFILCEACPAVFSDVAEKMAAAAHFFAGGRVNVRAVLFDYEGAVAATAEKHGVQS